MKLLPHPRSLQRESGTFRFPARAVLHLDPALPRDTVLLPVAARLQSAAAAAGIELGLITGPLKHPQLAIRAFASPSVPSKPAAHTIHISKGGVELVYRDEEGLRAGVATLRQLFRQYGRALPCLKIRDHADFPKRGVMLDISRGRVPRLETLLELASQLADFKINEFQLYTEHTFAYRDYEPVWRDWGPITGEQILILDAHCRALGIELVPNQNSFGHLRYWLAYPPLKKLAETPEPWPDGNGAFLRHPATLAPNHPGTIPFLRGLYDELLPHFTSKRFNVGCDETWDLGRGQSKELCARRGTGRVYVDFLKRIHRETTARKKQMMFWGDIVMRHPELVKELPRDMVALNWGYDDGHPFGRESKLYARSKIPFYVCPGTSTWASLIGRHDNALANLRQAAAAGRRHGAIGYLNTDWGDGGHMQPLAVSYIPYLAGASLSWCGASHDDALLAPVLDRDVFQDRTGVTTSAAFALGLAYRKLNHPTLNTTPLGATITAPPPKLRELFCRDGLKYFARIPAANIRAALEEIETQRATLRRAAPAPTPAKMPRFELDIAANMAAESCHFMLWQQSLAAGRVVMARKQARRGIAELRKLEAAYLDYWPKRNQGDPRKYWPCLAWRIRDYRRGVLPISVEQARAK